LQNFPQSFKRSSIQRRVLQFFVFYKLHGHIRI
jgi:hypothetical protein